MVLNTRMVKEREKGLIPCFYQTGLGPSSQLNHPVWFKPQVILYQKVHLNHAFQWKIILKTIQTGIKIGFF